MQPATAQTVLGRFDGRRFNYHDIQSSFFKKDGRFIVHTDSKTGEPADFVVTHTFGAEPLQQYLITFPDGRRQALSIAWDSRPKEQGGQRWFHLYPDENITHEDDLHWTGPNQNWNYMCAACHSTNLEKGYDLEQDRYETTWSDMDVSCEACHGPGSSHVAWANSHERGDKSSEDNRNGLVVNLEQSGNVEWVPDPATGTAKPEPLTRSKLEIDTCAHCHSRRTQIHSDQSPGKPYLDAHLPALLDERLYHADGQILEEVYVYGSFLQSKMYRAGVSCRDCHEPHSLEVRAAGNKLCTRCHLADKFDSPKHSFHEPKSPGSQCVACHMPSRNYMVVDSRRDHSFRVPRPDLSIKLGTPNACNQCHQNETARWASDILRQWHGPAAQEKPHYGEGLYAGREGLAEADLTLAKLFGDAGNPGIARATALPLLGQYPGRAAIEAISSGLMDKDPLVRIGALRALQAVDPKQRFGAAEGLLRDPTRAVRIEAARALAPVSRHRLTSEQKVDLKKASDEYIQAQLANAEHSSSHLNLGIFYVERGRLEKAEAAYRTALRLDPSFVPGYVNLADLYRVQQRDEEGKSLLQQALAIAPHQANLHQAYGLLLVRLHRPQEAISSFKRAAELEPDDPRHGYVYGIALNSTGKPEQAMTVLEATHRRHPNDRQILQALASIHRDQGNRKAAIRYAEKLVALSPNDPSARQLLSGLLPRHNE